MMTPHRLPILVRRTLSISVSIIAVSIALEARAQECSKLRFATFNVSLTRSSAGELIDDLAGETDAQAAAVAEIIQRTRPDVLLLNEIDYDAAGGAVTFFQENYLAVPQNGAEPIEYEFVFLAPSNTGVPSGLDLDNDGSTTGPGDAFGFGFFRGQFGMALLSRFPIEEEDVRTFQTFLWRDMPGALLPDDAETETEADWYSPAELDAVRLSSKSHWDVPVQVGDTVVHVLASHPTPPVFDGPEDRNGRRNHDEIRFWADYVQPETSRYIVDDDGIEGGLAADDFFVIVGDLNADPNDGDSTNDAADQLLEHPRVNVKVTPRSVGAVERSAADAGANEFHSGDPRFDTADFADGAPGNLRVDYVLPSSNLDIENSAVFWPAGDSPLFDLVGTFPFPSSDHRLVWVDVSMPPNGPKDTIASIASGDVEATAALLWARVSTAGSLRFEVALDESFERITTVRQLSSVEPLLPAKLRVTGLRSGTRYHYRASRDDGSQRTGSFRTADLLGTRGALRFGVSGDWRGELAPYPSIRNAAEQQLDFFIALGDTIYADYSSPRVPAGQARSVEDFRRKHAEVYSARYGSDTLSKLRESTATFAMIDDHEVTNDFSGGAPADSDPRFDPTGASRINETALYRNGLQAFIEHNPLQSLSYPPTGDDRFDQRPKLYRTRTFGTTAAIFLLDARSFRDEALPPVLDIGDAEAVTSFWSSSFDPTRTMLGRRQIEELQRDLLSAQESGVVWKFVAVPEPIQNLGALAASDRFEGYAAERTELLRFIDENGITDVVFVAADIHGTVVNNLVYRDAPGEPDQPTSAIEVTTGSVAFDAPLGPTVVDLFEIAGLFSPEERELYESLSTDEKDATLEELFSLQLAIQGFDPIGLEGAPVSAELLDDSWIAAHTYGWTEFEIDPVTFRLRVTTWGVEPYTEEDLHADPCAVVDLTPTIRTEFRLDPLGEIADLGNEVELSFQGPASVAATRAEPVVEVFEALLTVPSSSEAIDAWSYGIRAENARIVAIDFESSVASAFVDRLTGFARHEIVEGGAIGTVMLSTTGAATLPSNSRTAISKVAVEIDLTEAEEVPEHLTLSWAGDLGPGGAPFPLSATAGGVVVDPSTRDLVVAIEVGALFRRGDSNGDARLGIGDAVRIFGFLFRGNPPALSCEDAADANDSGVVDLSDGVRILTHLFLDGLPLPLPIEDCGEDPTYDELECAKFELCE